jgi:hypothetical protein
MVDTSWRIRTKANGEIIADALVESMPQYRRGEQTSMTFLFARGTYGATGDGWTYGGTEGATWGGANGAVFGAADETNAHIERYRQLREYLDWAGAVAFGRSLDRVPWYREQLPARANVSSEVVALEPSPDLEDRVPGLWALIVGGRDETTLPGADHRITLDVIVLAELDEYADHTAVENDLSA